MIQPYAPPKSNLLTRDSIAHLVRELRKSSAIALDDTEFGQECSALLREQLDITAKLLSMEQTLTDTKLDNAIINAKVQVLKGTVVPFDLDAKTALSQADRLQEEMYYTRFFKYLASFQSKYVDTSQFGMRIENENYVHDKEMLQAAYLKKFPGEATEKELLKFDRGIKVALMEQNIGHIVNYYEEELRLLTNPQRLP